MSSLNILSTIKLSKVSQAFIIYAIAFAMAGLTPFILLPVLTNALDPTEFGIASSFIISSIMTTNILGISAYGILSVRFFKEKKQGIADLLITSFCIFLFNHIIATLISIFVFDYIGYFTTLPLEIGSLVIFSAFWSCINLVSLSLFQSADRPGLYLLLRCIQTAVEIGGCLLLLQYTPDATSRIYSYSAALAASAFVGIIILVRWGLLSGRPTLARTKEILAFGLPMLPHIAAGVIIMNVDRIFVSSFLGAEGLGVFMVAMQLGLALSLFTEPLNKALAPWLFKQLSSESPSFRSEVVKNTYYIFLILIFLSIIISILFWCFFQLIFDKSYIEAQNISFLIAIGVAFQGMYYCMVNYIFYVEATRLLSKMTISVAIIASAISYVLISQFGLVGGAAAFAINNLLLFLAVWYMANRVVPMPWFASAARGR